MLYKYGGWYADIYLKPLLRCGVTENTQLIYFYDHGQGPCEASHACQNGFFYVKSGHALMKDCISQILENCENKYYGYGPLTPTGQEMFGKKLAKYVPSSGVHKGYFMQLTPFHRLKNRAYVGPNGEIMALHRTAWWSQSEQGSLKEFGAIGTNSYLEMWSNKDVYLDLKTQ